MKTGVALMKMATALPDEAKSPPLLHQPEGRLHFFISEASSLAPKGRLHFIQRRPRGCIGVGRRQQPHPNARRRLRAPRRRQLTKLHGVKLHTQITFIGIEVVSGLIGGKDNKPENTGFDRLSGVLSLPPISLVYYMQLCVLCAQPTINSPLPTSLSSS